MRTTNEAAAVQPRDMANAIRALSVDAVTEVQSGHPGLPLGAADIATALFSRFMVFDPEHPDWPDRDRFVLSAGHGSMLLYAISYLTGYEAMTLDEIRRFRRLGSRTPGHPEYDVQTGVEVTTGPLGQGLANGVGMALAEQMLRERFGADLVNHYTYVLVGDGCLMEGISYEATALAGHLGLGRLIVLFDDNGISIDGPTSLATSEDHEARFRANGWNFLRSNGHDIDDVARAIAAAKAGNRPTLIACKTTIGLGLPGKMGTAAAHGSAPSIAEAASARASWGWTAPAFEVPPDILGAWRIVGARGANKYAAWVERMRRASPELRETLQSWLSGKLPSTWTEVLADAKEELREAHLEEPTRTSSRRVVKRLMEVIPNLVGGSADLTASNLSKPEGVESLSRDNFLGRYIHFGVREHAMAAISTGIKLHGGFRPYCATFLAFADYLRPSLRLAALMRQNVVYLLTHDTITMGPDGPTHQSVEQFAMLRATPNFLLFRPADAVEVAECWELALKQVDRPVGLVMTREAVPPVRSLPSKQNLCERGAYTIAASDQDPEVTLLATGSEVWVALEAHRILETRGVPSRVISMPCLELFEEQPNDWQEDMLGTRTLKVSIEAGSVYGWDRYVGQDGISIGMHTFGASGLPSELMEHFGITPQHVARAVMHKLSAKA